MSTSDTLSGKWLGTRGRAGLLFLVVDDDALSRDLLTLLLEVEGYEVEAAVSGEDAVARIAVCKAERRPLPDVILTDIQMPGLAGNDLADALRAQSHQKIQLLAMSGSRPPAAALTGFDGFLLKPFNVKELRSVIDATAPTPQKDKLAFDAGKPAPGTALTSESGAEAIDEEIYEKMCELMPTEQLGQMYALCVDDARKRIARMQELAIANDDAKYRGEAHAVKGGCGMIGATELHHLAASAERDGLTQCVGTTTVTGTLTQLSLACDRLERILGERTRE